MIAAQTLSKTQYRLACHYLNKLHTANASFRRGQANITYGLHLFDQEWEQIRHWQTWAAERMTFDEASARLCIEFSLAGLELLSNRTGLSEYVSWLESALEAVVALPDVQAEKIILHHLTEGYYQLGMLDHAESFARKLQKLAEAAHDKKSLGTALADLGHISEERGHYPEAQAYYQQALKIFTGLGEHAGMAQAWHGLGAVALYTGDYENANRYFTQDLEWVEANGSQAEICNSLLSTSESLMLLDQYDEARSHIQRVVDQSRLLGFRRIHAAALLSLASWSVEQNQLETACDYFKEAIQVARSIGSERNVIHGLSNLGYTLMRLGNYDEALTQLQSGLQLARGSGMPRYICNLQRNLANTYIAVKDFDAAAQALHESLTLGLNLISQSQQVRTISVVVAYYAALDLPQQAAVWAGTICDEPNLDQPLFKPVCDQLEAVLGTPNYQQALQYGKKRPLNDVMSEILTALSARFK